MASEEFRLFNGPPDSLKCWFSPVDLMETHYRLVLGLLFTIGVSLPACSASNADAPGGSASPQPAVPVTVDRVVQKEMPLEVTAVGAVEAYSTVAVRAQVTGEMKAVNFQQGDDVQAGQVLFTLDPRPLEAALNQAEANLQRDTAQAANAKVIAQRMDDLVERGVGTREQRDTARTTAAALDAVVGANQAAVENARVQLQYATIRAPIAGRTGALMVHAGNLVRANDQTALVVINQVSPIYVSFGIPEALLPDLRRYMTQRELDVQATPPNDSGPGALGRITFVDNQVDQTTGTIRIKATFPNASRSLWPGQFVNVTIRMATDPRATVVPSVAVQAGPEGQYVYVVKNDQTVEMRKVTVRRTAGAETILQEGVKVGETVVTDGQLRLVPGSRISVKGPGTQKADS